MSTTITRPTTTTFLLGVSTVIAQSVLLREAMAAMGGSEMAWGLVMALWLAGIGLGARTGIELGSPRLATVLPVVTIALAGIGTILFRAAPAILGATPGETLTTWHGAWLWALAVIPSAWAGGLAFPILAGELGERGAGRAYTIEACGALGGGLIVSVALFHLGTAAALIVATGVVGVAQTWPYRRTLAITIGLGCAALATPAGEKLARASWRWSGHPAELGSWAETRHQRLEVSTGPPFALYANGRLESSFPDPYDTGPRAHLMMLLHPEPRHVLAVGCAADGSAEAMLQHPVDELILVEEDPGLLPLLRGWFGAAFNTPLDRTEVQTRESDPLRAISGARDLDLVILADGDPTTLRRNRTRTVEFFRRCRQAMGDGGIIIVEVGVSDTYLGGDGGRLLAMLANTLREVFPQMIAVPGGHVLLVAAGSDVELDTSLVALEERLNDRARVADAMHPIFLELLLDPARHPFLASFLDTETTDFNTTVHPRAVSLAVNLHEARSRSGPSRMVASLEPRGPSLLFGSLVGTTAMLLALAAAKSTVIRATAAAWAVGFFSMSWWLLLLGSWQATRGSVYAEVGSLTAAFMAGVAAGGWIGVRARSPERALPWIIASSVVLSLIIASGLALSAPIPAVPILLTIGGLITGAAFPGLGGLAGGGQSRRGAGFAFAADEIGAASAALIIGTVAIPWVGMTATALGLAILGLAAVPTAARR